MSEPLSNAIQTMLFIYKLCMSIAQINSWLFFLNPLALGVYLEASLIWIAGLFLAAPVYAKLRPKGTAA